MLDLKDGNSFSLYKNKQESTKIVIKSLFNFVENGNIDISESDFEAGDTAIWATISNKGLEKQSNNLINDYETRSQLIDTIVNFVSKYRVKGINIDFKEVENQHEFDRFIIEITPRLRELGMTTNIILNSSLKDESFVGVVDYLISEKED